MSTIPVNRVVSVEILTTPTFPSRAGFGVLLILGKTPSPLTPAAPIRFYSGIDGVGEDFSSASPEYQAAQIYFSQSPKPKTLAIGLNTAAPASLTDTAATLVAEQVTDVLQTITSWQAITAGSLSLVIDGTPTTAVNLNFSGVTDLADVAAVIQVAPVFAGLITVTESGGLITLTTVSTGAAAYLAAPATPLGGSIVEYLGIAGLSSNGVSAGAGTPIGDTLSMLAGFSTAWYGFTLVGNYTEQDILDCAAWAEPRVKVFGFSTDNADVADNGSLSNLALTLNALNYSRTFGVYDDNDAYAAVSVFARAFSVNFNNENSTITLKFKQLPGITPVEVTETQRLTLVARHINFYATYGEDTKMLAEGVMVNGRFFDEVHGLDWLQNAIENEVFGYMFTSPTKIPQTDRGTVRLLSRAAKACREAVRNGLLAPGYYNGDPVGTLQTGDFISEGFYLFAQAIKDQPQADREARKAPPIQGILKGAGAFHFADISLTFER